MNKLANDEFGLKELLSQQELSQFSHQELVHDNKLGSLETFSDQKNSNNLDKQDQQRESVSLQ